MDLKDTNKVPSGDECYICKKCNFINHSFYKFLCKECGEFNYQKRFQKANLEGYTALVTGGRIKIGYETALKLLRCGAHVIVTSRFPQDTAFRYKKEKDFSQWKNRLKIYGIDFRHLESIEKLINYIKHKIKKIDIIINNAAQTVRKPPIFYKHLMNLELSNDQNLLSSVSDLFIENHSFNKTHINESSLIKIDSFSKIKIADKMVSAQLSQIPLIPGDEIIESEFFPKDKFDKDGQQEDRRPSNSWVLKLDEVNLIEFLEVLYINLVTPFLINSKLKDLLIQNQYPSYIINVTAMEGNFFNPEKSENHVHTNMSKAALNMMTRTSAVDYANNLIYMNSVDVGWITNERPCPLGTLENERISRLAIDEVDGAARILDPIFSGINHKIYEYGNLYKNYKKYPW